MTRRTDDGFTLPELLVAITILGIIMIAIGSMITTSFRTSETVSAELQGSGRRSWCRATGCRTSSRRMDFSADGGCGSGSVVATFTSPVFASAFDDASYDSSATPPTRLITWSVESNGGRSQLVRTVCGAAVRRLALVVVSDVSLSPHEPNTSRVWRLAT